MSPLVPCLWFDRNAAEAVDFYLSVFPGSKIEETTRYPASSLPQLQGREGELMVIRFQLRGQSYLALNGGPEYSFTPAISLCVECDTQEEIDYYWEALGEGGPVEARQCGWLQDRFGLSWQIVPKNLGAFFQHEDPRVNARVMTALHGMQKIRVAALETVARIQPDQPDRMVSQRCLAHSAEAIFAAFTNPERLARWWGPAGFRNEFRRCDIRAGGDWEFDMIAPEGTRYRNESRFLSIDPPRQLVIEHLGEGHHFVLTISLLPEGDATRLEWMMDFSDPGEVERVLAYAPRCNEEVFDRLEEEISRGGTP